MYRKRKRKIRPAAAAVLVLALCVLGAGIWLTASGWIRSHFPAEKPSPSSQGSSSQAASGSSAAAGSKASASSSALLDPLLMIVNKDHPVPDDYNPTMTTVPTKYYVASDKDNTLDARAAGPLESMINAAAADGISLCIVSGHRSKEYQESLIQNDINKYLSQGDTQSEAESKTAVAVAPAGASEHQTGLAVDLGYNGSSNLTASYDKTPAFTWLKSHSVDYGFILRYPKDKVDVTQYEYEPWHYRYVGVDNAKRITESGLCLEEYVAKLQAGS